MKTNNLLLQSITPAIFTVEIRFSFQIAFAPGISFDFGPFHVHTESWSSFEEELMVVASMVGALTDTLKAIKIELSLEGCQFRLAKETGHDFGDKATGLVNGKGTPVREEGKDVAEALLLTGTQASVELFWEGFQNTASVPPSIRWRVHHSRGI